MLIARKGPPRGFGRVIVGTIVGMLAAAAVLSIPAPRREPVVGTPTPFRWDAAELFTLLEANFLHARALPLEQARARADSLDLEVSPILDRLGPDEAIVARARAAAPDTAPLDGLARIQFEYALLGAAHPVLLGRAQDLARRARVQVMRAASLWPADRVTHEALYRVVFGGRIALEEALVQAGPDALPPLVAIEDVPSRTPFLEVGGVRVHSGDILLSRGGAPTSALIARGSDFANTFSHAALAHVDGRTGIGTVLESLIERGFVVSSVDEYLESKKHKILVLRLSPDHPALLDDPLLPHRAASHMLDLLASRNVPYDFAMTWSDDAEMFCSEVVYHAFRQEGVELWPIRSAMSTPGLVRWLAAMGVREFRTLVPSDLEYDAQLRAVAEWRDLPALMDYRRDNAITDVLLEQADHGRDLGFAWYTLPVGRLVKSWSVIQAALGATPTIPSGMSTGAALRVSALVSTVQPHMKEDLVAREAAFVERNGYRAPYWTLVALARESLAAVGDELGPALR